MLMKRLAFLFLLMHLGCCIAWAQQNDPRATAILDAMSAKYKSYTTLRTNFVLKVENHAGKVSDEYQGTLHTKGDMYKLELPDRDIYCNNKTIWAYIKSTNEVQISDYDANEESIIPSQFYTMYQKDFFYALVDEKKVNDRIYQIIEMTPHDKSKNYFKIRLTIDKQDKQIVSAKVFEKSGNHYVYEIQKQTPNLPLNDSFFVFDAKKFPGVEIVDLR